MQTITLPVLDAAHCAHAALPAASCQACVKACPRGAWKLDESALQFDSPACDGCGLCVPSCPERAIHMPLRLEQRQVGESEALLARCEKSGDEGEAGCIPCLHRIGVHELLRHWREGRRVWLTRRGACEHCQRGLGGHLATRIASLNAGLAASGQPLIVLREVSPAMWQKLIDAPRSVEVSRRGFFTALRKRPVMALTNGEKAEEDDTRPPGALLPEGYEGILPWHVRIDALRCVACHACARVCPHGAIELADGEFPMYRLRHTLCTGCGLCRDACAHAAVKPISWEEPQRMVLRLEMNQCPSCGQAFQAPAAGARKPVCWLCASARPARPKRQVMS